MQSGDYARCEAARLSPELYQFQLAQRSKENPRRRIYWCLSPNFRPATVFRALFRNRSAAGCVLTSEQGFHFWQIRLRQAANGLFVAVSLMKLILTNWS
jgi:hypothetical protein